MLSREGFGGPSVKTYRRFRERAVGGEGVGFLAVGVLSLVGGGMVGGEGFAVVDSGKRTLVRGVD